MADDVNWELIIHRLDSVIKSQNELNDKLSNLDEKVTKIETIKHSVDVLKSWKEAVETEFPITDMKAVRVWKDKVNEIVSPSQLKGHITDIENLKTFKTKATMIWVVIQAAIFLIYFLDKALGLF